MEYQKEIPVKLVAIFFFKVMNGNIIMIVL